MRLKNALDREQPEQYFIGREFFPTGRHEFERDSSSRIERCRHCDFNRWSPVHQSVTERVQLLHREEVEELQLFFHRE